MNYKGLGPHSVDTVSFLNLFFFFLSGPSRPISVSNQPIGHYASVLCVVFSIFKSEWTLISKVNGMYSFWKVKFQELFCTYILMLVNSSKMQVSKYQANDPKCHFQLFRPLKYRAHNGVLYFAASTLEACEIHTVQWHTYLTLWRYSPTSGGMLGENKPPHLAGQQENKDPSK